ncbi:cytochrome c biogenesis protein CcsA [Sulfurovum sp. zt1-1]|uniref:Cytochrome c biogenesis protein CcsA n=1 Tax=Sulfurovum zhangzhouensis TaxID=3019067 RepID=A0ABT7QZA3_9BACT|nr:cytochrome c biogenesis protein CcsA [Sulfurovum zhangzhouensis]MDM5271854.1 cytochrome c biogenesis protein CcsA [Sulfurovum zhangzhouensis]
MLKHLLSMKMAVLVLFIFGVTAGVATFIENDYGTQTAKALIYKAKWFEVFLIYFVMILVYNILKFKSYKNKFPVFLFHFSFLIIALGALITRYIGYEGTMHIREGHQSNVMVSDMKLLQVAAREGDKGTTLEKELYLSSMTKNDLHESLKAGDKKVDIELLRYLPTYNEKIVEDPNGKKILELKISAGSKGEIYYLAKGELKEFDEFDIAYETAATEGKPTLVIREGENGLTVEFPYIINTLSMNDRSTGELAPGINDFKQRMLYRFGNNAVVLKDIHPKARLVVDSTDLKNKPGKPEFLEFKVSVGDQSKIITATPHKDETGKIHQIELNGVKIDLRVGAKIINVPFTIKLDDFKLERYPGSMTPSSYSSDVTLIDKEKGINQPYQIYMNHVLDHRGYRLFQSSYDPDEKGTILSINHDPGTLPTYIGYILLTIGMFWSLFIKNGRFMQLLKKTKKLQQSAAVLLVAGMMASSPTLKAATPVIDEATHAKVAAIDKAHAKAFGRLIVQDMQGRMKPMDTMAHEVVAKVSGKSSIFGLDPTQVLLGMAIDPGLYQELPIIKIGHPKIAVKLGLPEDAKFAKFSDFFDQTNDKYKLYEDINLASQKKPLEKSQYDKKLIEIDERVNVSYMVFTGSLLQIFPKPKDENNKWFAPLEALKQFAPKDAQMVQLLVGNYFQQVDAGMKSGDWSNADKGLDLIAKFQENFGKEVMPSQKHIDMEIKYNELGLFGKLVPVYILLGVILLILAFVNTLKPSFSIKWPMRIALSILSVAFIVHIIGLAIRWYIAGHAPWSNAYESIVVIALTTVFAGLVLARQSPFALAGTAILAGITMGVAHMNFINPEITNLVPVLKSYWLMIHVATIISGDGFLGLGSILAFLVLILFIIRGKGNTDIDRSIKELTSLSEMSLIIGLILMTVGNFLGGVWANESWGRYWGWDPKETWAAVTILIYASVLHMRFVPALKSVFIYNVAALWSYSTVIMTYFGVNYYLSGLHSYAAGDPVPIPMWVYYAVAGLFVLTVLAARNRKIEC